MNMQENLPAAPQRGRGHGAMYAHRKRKNDFATMCFAEMKQVLSFWLSVMNDENRPLDDRLQVADRIANRAVGAIPKPALEEGEGQENLGGNAHITFQWLPADPSDHSRVIEPS
jgi:hypothetical protein